MLNHRKLMGQKKILCKDAHYPINNMCKLKKKPFFR